MKKRAFTLIQLLIVITIIGILAAALLPSILNAPGRGREAARTADEIGKEKIEVNTKIDLGSIKDEEEQEKKRPPDIEDDTQKLLDLREDTRERRERPTTSRELGPRR